MGATVWQVNNEDHVVTRFTAYHNGKCGVYNGAYANPYAWNDCDLYGNGGTHPDPTIPHTQFFDWTGARDVGDVASGRSWQLTNSRIHAEGQTGECVIVTGRAVVQLLLKNGQDGEPGDYLGNDLAGAPIGYRWTFDFHDFGPYKSKWHIDAANTYEAGMVDVKCDMDGLGVHPDSTIVLDGVGTLHPPTYPAGTFDPVRNAKIT